MRLTEKNFQNQRWGWSLNLVEKKLNIYMVRRQVIPRGFVYFFLEVPVQFTGWPWWFGTNSLFTANVTTIPALNRVKKIHFSLNSEWWTCANEIKHWWSLSEDCKSKKKSLSANIISVALNREFVQNHHGHLVYLAWLHRSCSIGPAACGIANKPFNKTLGITGCHT